jgi:hypothetical protein
MTDPGNALRTSEERQIAAELMASIDAHTLGGVHAVDRIQVRQPDDVDPGTLLSTVHSGSHATGEEISGSFAPTELADLESDRRETVDRPNNTDDGTLTFSSGAADDSSAVGAANDVAAGGDDADTFVLSEAWGNGASDGGGDVGWTDVIELRDADGNILADGWSFDTASGSERQSVTVSGVPSDASLSAGTKNSDGTWTLTQEDFSGLTLVLAAGANPDLSLTATPTSTEVIGGDTTPAPENFDVPVDTDADAPTPTVNEVSGTEEPATTEAPVRDAASFGSDELSSPNLQIPTDETTENPIRVARRLMPDSETESEFVSPVAPEILGGQELSNSPIRANEELDENPAELNFGAIEPPARRNRVTTSLTAPPGTTTSAGQNSTTSSTDWAETTSSRRSVATTWCMAVTATTSCGVKAATIFSSAERATTNYWVTAVKIRWKGDRAVTTSMVEAASIPCPMPIRVPA